MYHQWSLSRPPPDESNSYQIYVKCNSCYILNKQSYISIMYRCVLFCVQGSLNKCLFSLKTIKKKGPTYICNFLFLLHFVIFYFSTYHLYPILFSCPLTSNCFINLAIKSTLKISHGSNSVKFDLKVVKIEIYLQNSIFHIRIKEHYK